MASLAYPTRRILLKDMGKAGLAIVVLGSVACTPESTAASSTSTTDGDEPATSTSSTVPSTTASTAGAGSTSPTEAGAYEWARASLGFVSAFALYRAGEAVLVDTGVANSAPTIETALGEVGLSWTDIGQIVVTHKHPDHQGSLDAVLSAAPDAVWFAGAGDMASIVAARTGTVVGDGDRVFDLEIIETPGHTVGHIAVLDPVGGVLVAGDALFGTPDGGVTGSDPQFTEDLAVADASVQKLAGLEYEVVLFGHGEPITSGGAAAVAEYAATLG